jgi:RHS repeat-associated protein
MPYKFNGKEQDAETGLYYYGARYYEPKECRFMGVDPIFEKFYPWTPYNYAFCNPTTMVDLWGLQGINANEAWNWEQNNWNTFAEASHKVFTAMLSVFSSKAEVHTTASTSATLKTGNVTTTQEVLTESKFELSINPAKILGDSPESRLQSPFSVSTSKTVTEKSSVTLKNSGVQIEGARSTNSNGESTKSLTISKCVDMKKIAVQGVATIENKTTSIGNSSTSLSTGLKVDVTISDDKITKTQIGGSLLLTPGGN